MMLDRFADIFGKSLAGAITRIDLTDLMNQGGLSGLPSSVNSGGGIEDLLYRKGVNKGFEKGPFNPNQTYNNEPLQPYHKDYKGVHGIADFNHNYDPTFDIPGGPITPQEMQRMNKNYPIA